MTDYQKNCANCRHSAVSDSKEPCAACIAAEHSGDAPPFGGWEPR